MRCGERCDCVLSTQTSARLTGCGKYWYRSIEITCGDYYEGFFVNSCKSGIGAYTFSTAKAKYIGMIDLFLICKR